MSNFSRARSGSLALSGFLAVRKWLLDQLKPGGLLVIPIGAVDAGQSLTVFEKKNDGTIIQHDILPVRFVPLTGEHTKK